MDFTSAIADSQRFIYADSGEGPTVVLLHGFPDTPHGWADARDALNGAGYRTVVPYLRGYHPDTIVAGRGYGAREISEDVVRLLDAIDADQAVLVGHDWGAAITYRAAAIAPARIRAICAVAIPHPQLLQRSLGLLWRGRHFLTLSLPSGRWLARHNDFAYLDADAPLGAELVGPRARGQPRRCQALLRRSARAGRGARLLPRRGATLSQPA